MLSLFSCSSGICLVPLYSVLPEEIPLNLGPCLPLVCVIQSFVFTLFYLTKGVSQGIYFLSEFPLCGIPLCSRTGYAYIYLQPHRNGRKNESLLWPRTGHKYIYLQPDRNGCRFESSVSSRTEHIYIYLQSDRNGCSMEALWSSKPQYVFGHRTSDRIFARIIS